MHFRLTHRALTFDDLELLYVVFCSLFRWMSQIWEARMAK